MSYFICVFVHISLSLKATYNKDKYTITAEKLCGTYFVLFFGETV